jgi:hypothetical protein
MITAVAGIEYNPMLGPRNGGIMELEPSHTEDNWVVAEARDIELDIFCMRSDLKLDREGFLNDDAGRDRTSINNFEVSRSGLRSEANRVGLDKVRINKGSRSAGIDHGISRDRGIK